MHYLKYTDFRMRISFNDDIILGEKLLRKGKSSEITITEEVYIEGADVTLEPSDKVRVLEKTNNELGYLDWEMMQLDT